MFMEPLKGEALRGLTMSIAYQTVLHHCLPNNEQFCFTPQYDLL